MSLVYSQAQKYGLIPRTQEANPLNFVEQSAKSNYKAVILTPEQASKVISNLTTPFGTGINGLDCRDGSAHQRSIGLKVGRH